MAENDSKRGDDSGKKRSRVGASVAPGQPPATAVEGNRGDTVSRRKSGPTELPPRFGRYRVIRKLGGGGMGTVYLVENTELEREEALKVPHFSDGDDPQLRERFLREAKSAAKLDHSNLCPIYDAGVQDGTYYMTMRFLKGKLLADYIGQAQPMRKTAEIVAKLAQALEAAHTKGVIHRDLKPGNVMMVSSSNPVVMDFGLAKQVQQADQKLTQAGSMLGTPAYMPPEQLHGELEQMGPASDVYSLGVILYELLTGRLPFEGTVEMIFAQIPYVEPPLPSALISGLNPALDAICRKAMAKAPTQRYSSMKAFATALQDYLRSAPATEGAGNLVVTAADNADVFEAATVAPGRPPAGNSDPFQAVTVPPRARQSLPSKLRNPQPLPETIHETDEKGEWKIEWPTFIGVSVVCFLVLFATVYGLWTGGVIKLPTANGILVIEVNEPNPELYVDGEKVTVDWLSRGVKAEIGLKPGTLKVELKKDGFGAFGEEVTLEDRGRTLLLARLEPIKPTLSPIVAPMPPAAPLPREGGAPPSGEVAARPDVSKPDDSQSKTASESAPAARKVYLSDLQETEWLGHGMFTKNGKTPHADIAINGSRFPKGLSTHPLDRGSSSVKYRLSGLDAATFVTKVGINDSADKPPPTFLTFQVLGDGVVLWTFAPMRDKGQTQECQVSVKNVRMLELRVDCPGWHGFAHAVWLDPYVMAFSPGDAVIDVANRERPASSAPNAKAEDSVGVLPVGADGRPLNFDFETGTLKDWKAEGPALIRQPIEGDTVFRRLAHADIKSQHQGQYWIGLFERAGDGPQGTLTSVPFKVTRPRASFLVGGGSHPSTCVELVRKSTNEVFSRTSGSNTEAMRRVSVDLHQLQGEKIFIRLVDRNSGGWGHINFDDFRFHE